MNQISILLFLFVAASSYAQTPSNSIKSTDTVDILIKKEELSKEALKTWWQKDYTEDTIPGVSLDKAYRELLTDKKGEDIIVAVLDTKLDIHHEDLKSQIWTNEDEIPDNEKDDDNNGYVDDVHGWDFLSNIEGDFVKYSNLEEARIVKAYDPLFKGKKQKKIPKNLLKKFQLYQKALDSLESQQNQNKKDIFNYKGWAKNNEIGKKILDSVFFDQEYNVVEIDSLIEIKKQDSLFVNKIMPLRNKLAYDVTDTYIQNYINRTEKTIGFNLNPNYNDREIMGDDPADINDKIYGSPIVYGDVPFQHSTAVTGILGANRSNTIGVKGFSNHIKIMPVVMVASGDEHDKDVAIAIRYAVDNGAKIINMSWGKMFSLREEWVNEAIKYAASKDVLLVTAAGNSNRDNDITKYYPNDYYREKEFANNFLVVGASTPYAHLIRAKFSNYGKKHVDIFAPGDKIYSTEHQNTYTQARGTSFSAPIVSGIAALLRSYYPNLTASEVKNILMESGTSYNVDVEITQEDGTKKMVPFSELSKSGKIVNAYNALFMAEQMVNSKK